ncbi:hypothetical protein [Bradyrhizobium cosmicum]|uniref:hypothetical protein n=1 Tax=Bradyrhizobium cosmicum TaxID=1404864 RepID=UPI0028EFCE5A|nr:hypothetical protein [Bradyrhizobium cosmicum]
MLTSDRPESLHLFRQCMADLLDLIWVKVMVQDPERGLRGIACADRPQRAQLCGNAAAERQSLGTSLGRH